MLALNLYAMKENMWVCMWQRTTQPLGLALNIYAMKENMWVCMWQRTTQPLWLALKYICYEREHVGVYVAVDYSAPGAGP